MPSDVTYSERLRAIDQCIAEIERTDDVERAMTLHAEAEAHLRACEATIERAKGQLIAETADGAPIDEARDGKHE